MLKFKTLFVYTKNDVAETYKDVEPLLIILFSIVALILLGIFAFLLVVLLSNLIFNFLAATHVVYILPKECNKKDFLCNFMISKIPLKCLLVSFDIFIFALLVFESTTIKAKTAIVYFGLNLLFLYYLNVDKITLYAHIIVVTINCFVILFLHMPKQITSIKNEIKCIEDGQIEIIVTKDHKKEDDNLISKYFLLQ